MVTHRLSPRPVQLHQSGLGGPGPVEGDLAAPAPWLDINARAGHVHNGGGLGAQPRRAHDVGLDHAWIQHHHTGRGALGQLSSLWAALPGCAGP